MRVSLYPPLCALPAIRRCLCAVWGTFDNVRLLGGAADERRRPLSHRGAADDYLRLALSSLRLALVVVAQRAYPSTATTPTLWTPAQA